VSAAGNTRMGCEEPRPPAIGQPVSPFKRFLAALIRSKSAGIEESHQARTDLRPTVPLRWRERCCLPCDPKPWLRRPASARLQARGYIKELEKVGLIAVDREK